MAQNYTIEQLNYGRKVYNFMHWNHVVFSISLILLVTSIAIIWLNGFNWGLDFTGGTVIEMHLEKPADLDFIRHKLKEAKFQDPIIQNFGSVRDIIVRIPKITGTSIQELSDKIITIMNQSIDSHVIVNRIEFIGPSIGKELAKNGSMALLVALLSILIYISLRFKWRLALGVVIALMHDVIITLGVLSFLQTDINLTIIASLMSVIGYSLNDSIVISDRIRENFPKARYETPYEIINVSLTQTLSRTILTSSVILIMVLVLYMFGGAMLHGFSLTMLIGILIGTISSIYVASALALKLGIKHENML